MANTLKLAAVKNNVKTHIQENKHWYFLGTGIIIGGIAVAIVRSTPDVQISQKVIQIGVRNKANPVIINLIERSTASKPVWLVGTDRYFSSISEAARETGHSLQKISRQINNHIPDVDGDKFQLLESSA